MKKLILTICSFIFTQLLFAQSFTESFNSGQTANATTFISNGKSFDLGNNWTVQDFTDFGKDDDWYVDNLANCPNSGVAGSLSTTDGSEIFVNSLWLFISDDCASNSFGSIKVYWYKDGLEVNSKTYNDILGSSLDRGFALLDFDADGSSCTAVDEMRFELLGDLTYVALDDFTWSTTMTPSSIGTVTSDKNNVCSLTDISLTANGVVLGAGASLSWYESKGGTGVNLGSTNPIQVSPVSDMVYFARIEGPCNVVEDSIVITIASMDTTVTENGQTLSAVDNPNFSYLWLDCDDNNASLGVTTRSFTAQTANGNYAVEITNQNCIDTSSCRSVNVLDINDNDYSEIISLFPNPAKDILRLATNSGQASEIQVFNSLGNKEDVNMVEENLLDISNLSRGIYIINLIENEKSYSLKFIKE